MDNIGIPGFDRRVFRICRIVFSLCILADALWYFISFETRSAYFRHLGLPVPLLYLLMAAYSFFGIMLLLNVNLELTCVCMIITYTSVGFIVHHPVGSGGIGDYPSHIHGEVNFLQVLSYEGLVGGLLVMFGATDMMRRKKIMHGSKSYAIVLGRAILGLHFMAQTLYFKLIQYSLRSKQITIMGGSPFFHIFLIGAIHVIASYYAWLGKRASHRKTGALILAVTTAVMTVVESASLATSTGVYHMKTEARGHQFIVQTGIACGCFLLYSTARMEAQPYARDLRE